MSRFDVVLEAGWLCTSALFRSTECYKILLSPVLWSLVGASQAAFDLDKRRYTLLHLHQRVRCPRIYLQVRLLVNLACHCTSGMPPHCFTLALPTLARFNAGTFTYPLLTLQKACRPSTGMKYVYWPPRQRDCQLCYCRSESACWCLL